MTNNPRFEFEEAPRNSGETHYYRAEFDEVLGIYVKNDGTAWSLTKVREWAVENNYKPGVDFVIHETLQFGNPYRV